MGNQCPASRRGFTLAEILLVLGIMTVVCLIAVPALFRMQLNTRQAFLDSRAELLFTLAQNQLICLRSSGIAASEGELCPYDKDELYFVHSDDSFFMAGDTSGLLPGYWIVEYSPARSSVHAVFYSEEDELSEYGGNRFQRLREYQGRIADGAHVGYYSSALPALSSSGATAAH